MSSSSSPSSAKYEKMVREIGIVQLRSMLTEVLGRNTTKTTVDAVAAVEPVAGETDVAVCKAHFKSGKRGGSACVHPAKVGCHGYCRFHTRCSEALAEAASARK